MRRRWRGAAERQLEDYVRARFPTAYERTAGKWDAWPFRILFDAGAAGRIVHTATAWGLATNFRWMTRLRETDHVIVISTACVQPGDALNWLAYLSELERCGSGVRRDNFYLLCNSRVETDRALQEGFVNARWVHQNCFLDPHIFFNRPDLAKTYDAVYIGRVSAAKRHHLASQVRNAYLIRYATDPERPPPFYVGYNQAWLSPHGVSEVLNRARVGLILSEMEGGNYGTTEYLLCGLPVVSTKIPSAGTLGGREAYLDLENSIYCEPVAEAVSAAVDDLSRRAPDPYRIRRRALEVNQRFIESFIHLLGHILAKMGVHDDARSLYARIFSHKLGLEWLPLAQVLKRIEAR